MLLYQTEKGKCPQSHLLLEGQLPAQCYQIEWLLKVQGNKWSYKRSPNDWETFWAILKNIAVE